MNPEQRKHYFLIQVLITLIQVIMAQAPLVLHMNMAMKLPRQCLGQLHTVRQKDGQRTDNDRLVFLRKESIV